MKPEVMDRTDRQNKACEIRKEAAEKAKYCNPPLVHKDNGDEIKDKHYYANFTKGLPHDYETGLVRNPDDYEKFVRAIDTNNPKDFKNTPLGPSSGETWQSQKANNNGVKIRGWESPGAGHSYDLQGPDAQAFPMKPAPVMGSTELVVEMAEVYAQALLRDIPLEKMNDNDTARTVMACLDNLEFYEKLSPEDKKARKLFRGITPGDNVGPYLSQFLLAGTKEIGKIGDPRNGKIAYGAITIDQRVRFAEEQERDYMTDWNEWFDVQQGANLRRLEDYDNNTKYRFITTGRDLATYVHYDALYQAYLNACLILLDEKLGKREYRFDPGIPYQEPDHIDHQQGFALFGPPHILTLVTEVATRALKAVRYQKFNVHRRLRPEALAARLEKAEALRGKGIDIPSNMIEAPGLDCILQLISDKNRRELSFANGVLRGIAHAPFLWCRARHSGRGVRYHP